jgi:chromate transporter
MFGAGIIGAIGGRIAPQTFATAGAHGTADPGYGAAIIDDHTPTPEHARFAWSRLVGALIVGFGLWAAVIAGLLAIYGTGGTLTQMAWFFTKAALLTFGGAYAVLPYVVQGAVEHYHWLTASQMIDGLALGETTPGPLIMVVAFVGFVGGWNAQVFGPENFAFAGAMAALVVTFFTFLPSFLFILIGGPLVETTHKQPHLTAPLTGITAAIVGVIVNLALFFAWHVLWPDGTGGGLEWPSLLVGVGALLALFRFRVGIIPVIAACGIAGLAMRMLLFV